MNVQEAVKTRRSTRKYTQDPVPAGLLDQIIEAGRYAPTGSNSQTIHFMVIKNREILDRLAGTVQEAFGKMEVTPGLYKSLVHSITASKAGNYIFHYNAPVLIVLANKKDYGNNIADCACALMNMMLAANEADLGSCWINQLKWLNEEPSLVSFMKELGLKDDERVYGALALGYADTEDRLPARKPLPRTGNPVDIIE